MDEISESKRNQEIKSDAQIKQELLSQAERLLFINNDRKVQTVMEWNREHPESTMEIPDTSVSSDEILSVAEKYKKFIFD